MKSRLREIRSFFRGINEGVSNVIKWFPLIYRDRDFDHRYMYMIMHKKLSNMEKFFRSEYTYTEDAIKTADEIKEVKEMLGRVMNDEHMQNVDISTDEFMNTKDGRFNVDRDNPNYIKWRNAMDNAEIMADKDLKDCFRIISEKSMGWWD